jgi:hypothetical protein
MSEQTKELTERQKEKVRTAVNAMIDPSRPDGLSETEWAFAKELLAYVRCYIINYSGNGMSDEIKIISEKKKLPAIIQTIDIDTRWEDGIQHDPRSKEIVEWLADYDWKFCDGCFDWKVGGDGDNGETLMYELDEYFIAKDKETKI